MDLGLRGRKAIVCGASRGLGFGCAASLAREGVHVFGIARDRTALEAAMQDLSARYDGRAAPVCADATSESGRAAILAACPEPDILVNNGGGPPLGDFRRWSEAMWIEALSAQMLAPILLIRSTLDQMIEKRFGRIVNITSIAVKRPEPLLGLSTGARAGLTGVIGGLARESARFNVTMNNLLPGNFVTDRHRRYVLALARERNVSIQEAEQELLLGIPARRFGSSEELGDACAFLCSASAGFITGQNLLLDGGSFPGLF